jgi:hypothetical protein
MIHVKDAYKVQQNQKSLNRDGIIALEHSWTKCVSHKGDYWSIAGINVLVIREITGASLE